MARPDKAAAVAEMSDQFTRASGAVLTDYRGLSVSELAELRSILGDDATYSVVKNTLTKIAAQDAGVDGLADLLVGPSAIAFVTGDPVLAAKGLRDFARTHPALVIKGGVLDGRPVGSDEISRMADLESREALLSKLAGALLASLQSAAYMFNAPLAQAARALGALQDQLGQAADPAAAEAPGPAGDEAPDPAADPAPDKAPDPVTDEAPDPATDPAPDQP